MIFQSWRGSWMKTIGRGRCWRNSRNTCECQSCRSLSSIIENFYNIVDLSMHHDAVTILCFSVSRRYLRAPFLIWKIYLLDTKVGLKCSVAKWVGFFTTWVVLRPFGQKSCLLVDYLQEKSYIYVQWYNDSKMLHYIGSGRLLCTRTLNQLNWYRY